MKLTPSSTTLRRVAMACSRLGGSPQIPVPVIRIAPKPRRLTVRSPPTSMVPAAAAVGCALTLPPHADRSENRSRAAYGSAALGRAHDDLANAGLHGQVGLEVPRQAGRRGDDPVRQLPAHRDRLDDYRVDPTLIHAFQAHGVLSRLGLAGDPDKYVPGAGDHHRAIQQRRE